MKKIFSVWCIGLSVFAHAQVKIGSPGTPNANAVLELDGGTNKGLLLPRLTTSNMNGTGLSSAPSGLLIYNITDSCLYIRKANTWKKVIDATNNGSFTLPYAGTASTLGGAEFSITHTTTFGDAAVFSNTANAGGVAVGTYSGDNKLNMTTGNTGIGIPNGLLERPELGKLVVRGTVGSTSAVFGDETSGVSVENNFPGLGFNSYYNNGRKTIVTGFGAWLGLNPNSGLFSLATSTESIAGQGTAMPLVDRINIKSNGNIGIEGNTDPQAPLSFAASLGKKISLYRGLAGDAGFGVYGNELRINSDYSGADITFGYDNIINGFTERMRIKGSGQVCIGTTASANGYLVSIGGKVIAEEVRVQLKSAWPDYVFSKNYKLRSLKDVARYISTNNHLPNVPAAADVERSGIALGEMQSKMMEKIEELTLYVIELKKEIEQMKSNNKR